MIAGVSRTHCGDEKSIPKRFVLVRWIITRLLMLHVMSPVCVHVVQLLIPAIKCWLLVECAWMVIKFSGSVLFSVSISHLLSASAYHLLMLITSHSLQISYHWLWQNIDMHTTLHLINLFTFTNLCIYTSIFQHLRCVTISEAAHRHASRHDVCDMTQRKEQSWNEWDYKNRRTPVWVMMLTSASCFRHVQQD
jgi:hypothetical protein